MPKAKLTKTKVDSIPFCKKSQIVWDSLLPGFGVRVGGKSKVFIVQGRINGKSRRVKIGSYHIYSLEKARKTARDFLYRMSKGEVPAKQISTQVITLKTAFDKYFEVRKDLKQRTIQDYKKVIGNYFKDWQDKPVTSITKEMVAKRHSILGIKSHAQANMAMRVLRAVFNFAMVQYEDSGGRPIIKENPVNRLSKTRAWYKVSRRNTVIHKTQLPAFLSAIKELKDVDHDNRIEVIRDYFLFLLFTGMRPGEARRLKWEDVDLDSKVFVLPDSKNSDPYALPLSDYLFGLLVGLGDRQENEYVFPGRYGTGHLVEPKRQVAKVSELSQITFMLTDLRRTFITIAESLDLSYYAVKRLLNHKISGDVTAGYIIFDVERLRKPMQRITDYILKAAGIKQGAEVIKLRGVK